jgi:hypothetical protein
MPRQHRYGLYPRKKKKAIETGSSFIDVTLTLDERTHPMPHCKMLTNPTHFKLRFCFFQRKKNESTLVAIHLLFISVAGVMGSRHSEPKC